MLRSKIDSRYIVHDCTRLSQGDILRDFNIKEVVNDKSGENPVEELYYPYLIVLSQDCDIENCYYEFPKTLDGNVVEINSYLPYLLVAPAFAAEKAKEGTHLVELYNINKKNIPSDLWRKITNNQDDRYHYLNGYDDFQIPNLLIDFKTYFTIPFKTIYDKFKDHYLATLNELFRERFCQRFCNYMNRIALPEKEILAKEQSK